MPVGQQLPIFRSPQPFAITILVFDSMNFTILGTSYQWNHAGFGFLWLSYFTEPSVVRIHPYCCILQNFLFFKLGNVLFSFSNPLWMDISIVPTSWLLWIMPQWTWECWCVFRILISVFLDNYPEVQLLGDKVVLIFGFLEPPYCFP